MQMPEPTPEHLYLLQLVGEWEIESECEMGPGQPPSKSTGTQSTRAIGSFWTLGEMETAGPDDKPMISLMTLGYDPSRGKIVGSFVASCMTHHWLYEGSLDADRRILTLEAEGPSFTGDGSMAKYHDIIEVIDQDTYLFSSQYQDSDGSWIIFMRGKHSRRK
ncbi:MAG: DUF1579 domain-containing protein [Pirellula sp.]|jgi:hypothetical protein|nr:DUF1579 domain-containing protein [Pirellula sp.]